MPRPIRTGPGETAFKIVHEMLQPALMVLTGQGLLIIQGTVFGHHVSLVVALTQQHLVPVLADSREMLLQIDSSHIQEHGRHYRVIQQPAIEAMHHGINIFPAIQIWKLAVILSVITGLKILNCGHYFASFWQATGFTLGKREACGVVRLFTNQYGE
jgi:hypothetical protein